jgi:hypothetical protein
LTKSQTQQGPGIRKDTNIYQSQREGLGMVDENTRCIDCPAYEVCDLEIVRLSAMCEDLRSAVPKEIDVLTQKK